MMQVPLLNWPVAQSSSTVVRFPDRVQPFPCFTGANNDVTKFRYICKSPYRTLEIHALNQASTVVLVTCLRPTRSQAPL